MGVIQIQALAVALWIVSDHANAFLSSPSTLSGVNRKNLKRWNVSPLHLTRQYLCRWNAKSNGLDVDLDENDYDSEQDENDFEISDQFDYGKFFVDEDDEDPLPPLPQFLNDEPIRDVSTTMDETRRRIEEQQKQIDLLMKSLNSLTGQSQMELTEAEPLPPLESSSSGVAPLRSMLFIDGTWLYYSIHERPAHLCPIIAKYGRGWQRFYHFDWGELPRVICQALEEQDKATGWGSNTRIRPVEISRANVFTSVKKRTSESSERIRMFEEMRETNYDVYMMETVGQGEKCIDIQLAVEMLHYATVPNSYDVAVLLSGDKDFMPALIRTRQKARKVAIVSMRSYCNRALLETPNISDYDVIWIEDYIDRLIVPKEGVDLAVRQPDISRFTLMKVIYDFIDKSDLPAVSSRDVGRYLKHLRFGDSDLQAEFKNQFRGLYTFLRDCRIFTTRIRSPQAEDPNDKSFWIGLMDDAEEIMFQEAKNTRFSDLEKVFFDSYSLEYLDQRDKAYESSLGLPVSEVSPRARINGAHFETPAEHNAQPVKNYSVYKLLQLKEFCRSRALPVSGTKAALIERLLEDDQQSAGTQLAVQAPDIEMTGLDSRVSEHLIGLVKEYLRARGGRASSRDIGRYLLASSSYSSRENRGKATTALSELKDIYGGLAKFIISSSDHFDRTEATMTPDGGWEFFVSLAN